ncbi:phage tail tape measure protein [Metapseudomonas otitidis]|uniref:phage tail tape measure protein n=1 Tax=Metapseudomonas otitidis TaxID=319939 RepID=UPI00244B91C8|nr:phage tail tape measure protein [Pseudomonas otitidis]MDG9780263.1 phage tail tape measure protein [Pseudomonas otitidis]
MDIASLGIEVRTESVQKAGQDLDRLSQAGAQAEQAARGVESSWGGVGQKVGAAAAPVSGTASAFKAGTEAIKAQQAELAKLIGQIDPVVGALGRLDDQQEKLRGFSKAGLLDAETFTQYNTKIEQARRALTAADDTIRKTGVSSAQTAAALRQLPAQFTDIVTSLQGGQAPLTVLLQQGGQIKDSFGGVGPALRETAKYAAGLINPFTLAAAAVGVLGVALYQGSQESVAFNKAIITSGNFAGTSASQLQAMAAAIDGVTGTQRQAAAALAEFTNAGVFTADQLQSLTTAAVAWEDATGQAISETVAQFKRLQDEPAAASAKLNEQYNYLTAAIYEQITALEAQGKESEAAQLATETYSQALIERSSEIEENLGYVEKAWKGIKDAAGEAWDSMLGVGREQSPMDRLDAIARTRSGSGVDAQRAGGATLLGGWYAGIASIAKDFYEKQTTDDNKAALQIQGALQSMQDEGEKSFVEGLRKQQEADAIKATSRVEALRKASLSNAQKKDQALSKLSQDISIIRAVNPESAFLTDSSIASLEKVIADKYKDPKERKTRQKAYQDDAATKMLMSLREEQSALEAQLSTNEKLTSEQKKRAEFEALIAQLKSKDVLTAEQKSLLASQDAIKAQLDRNVAISEEVRLRQESVKFQERAAQIQASIDASAQGRSEQYSRQLDAFGMGKRELERVQSEASIFREFRRYQDQLNKATPQDMLGSAEYKAQVEEIKSGLNDALRANEDYYRRLDELRGDWQNGTKAALADYVDSSKDSAGQFYDSFSKSLTGLEDALVNFVMTGKLSFSDLANSIIADLVRIEARKAIAFAIGGSESGGGSGFGGLLSLGFTAASAYFGGGLSASASGSLAAGASQSGYAMDLSNFVAGARAGGGPVSAGSMYQVGENNRPELLTQGGRSYLIPGDGGNVTPIRGNSGGGGVTHMTFNLPNVTNAREAKEAAGILQRSVGRAVQGSGRYM